MKTNHKLILSLLLMVLPLVGFAQTEEEPIITFKTTIYESDGESNAISLAFGSTVEGEYIDIDCGFGKDELEVGVATLGSDSTIHSAFYQGKVSKEGIVRIYGDPKKIDYFNASGCEITEIEFHKDLNLQILNLEYNTLKSLNVDHMSKLAALYLTDNPFTEKTPLNIGYLPNLLVLDVHQVGYISPDFKFSNFPNLTSFDAYHCLTLANADVTQNPNLVRLSLEMTAVEKLDVTKNSYLSVLNISDSRITTIDLSKNTRLSELYCGHGSGTINTDIKMSELDVTNNPQLYVLFCGGNNFTTLDLTKNPILFELSAPHCQFTSLDLSKNLELVNVNINDNNLDFATLPMPGASWSTYYYRQNDLPLDDVFKVGDVIDLSSRVLREGTTTTAQLFSVPKDSPTDLVELGDTCFSYANGKVTLLKAIEGDVAICYFNDVFSEDYLQTEKFSVLSAEDYGKDVVAVEFASDAAFGTKINMSLGMKGASLMKPVKVSVDFGNGTLIEKNIVSENPAANNIVGTRSSVSGNIKVYIPQGSYVTAFGIDGINVTNFNATGLTELRSLSVTNAGLYSIDLGYNTKLEKLNLSGNNLSSLTLQGPSYYFYKSKLSDINLSNNALETFTFDDLYAVKTLNLSNNKLTKIDVTNADSLHVADLSHNNFVELMFNHSEALNRLDVSYNDLDTIYVPATSTIGYVNISHNPYTIADMPTIMERFGSNVTEFIYAPQNEMKVAKKSPGVDLSSQFITIDGNSTQFAWVKEDGTKLTEGVDYTISNGSTKFINTTCGPIRCEMTNAAYPQFAGENVFVTSYVTPIEMPTIELASFVTPVDGETVELSLAALENGVSIYFDWLGNGNVTQYDMKSTYTRFEAQTTGGAKVRVLVADAKDKVNVFSISGCTMTDLDLTNIGKPFAISLVNAGLTEFNMPKNTSLGELNLSGNSLSSFDFTNCPNLYYLSLNGNKFKEIDLSPAEGLGLAYLGNNKLEKITLKNPNLWNLDLGVNNFSDLDLSGAPNLDQVWVNSNKLKSLDVSKLKNLKVLNVVDNQFLFSTLPANNCNVFNYGNQAQIPVTVTDNKIDLSSEAVINGSATTFRWFIGYPEYDDNDELTGEELIEGEEYETVNGITTFKFTQNVDDIVGVLINDAYPNLVLYTELFNFTPATGINAVTTVNSSSNRLYNLSGQQVSKNYKGIVIRSSDGKKVKGI